MTEVDHIRDAYFNKGETISEIAKRFSRDRKTVRKYIKQEDFNVPVPPAGEDRRSQPKLEPYMATIDGWLETDRRARRKQRHTARRIYDRLVETYEGFDCSYRTVATYVRRKKKNSTARPTAPFRWCTVPERLRWTSARPIFTRTAPSAAGST